MPKSLCFADRYLLNKRSCKEEDGVFIGRPSKWGNPYRVETFGRAEAIARYEEYIFKSGLINELGELYKKKLVCFCYPMACHGDILIKHLYKM